MIRGKPFFEYRKRWQRQSVTERLESNLSFLETRAKLLAIEKHVLRRRKQRSAGTQLT